MSSASNFSGYIQNSRSPPEASPRLDLHYPTSRPFAGAGAGLLPARGAVVGLSQALVNRRLQQGIIREGINVSFGPTRFVPSPVRISFVVIV